MENSQVTFDVCGPKPVPPHLTPLVAVWFAPEPDATRLFVAKNEARGMRVVIDRTFPRGPLALDAVEMLLSVFSDALYERLLAFIGVQPSFPVPPLPPSAEGS